MGPSPKERCHWPPGETYATQQFTLIQEHASTFIPKGGKRSITELQFI